MDDLETAIREFSPLEGNWLQLERFFEQAFNHSDPTRYYRAIFDLFERFPDDDGAGVFWSALHGMEAVGGYEELLLQSFRRHPTIMTEAMLYRIRNSGGTDLCGTALSDLIAIDPSS